MSNIRTMNFSLAIVFALVSGSAASQACDTPLPSDVVLPSAGPTERSAMLGRWGDAKWDGVLCHTLVVESMPTDTTAVVVYSHGVNAGWNIRAPGFFRLQGKFDGNTLHLDFPAIKSRVEYRLVNGKLHGEYVTPQSKSTIVLNSKP